MQVVRRNGLIFNQIIFIGLSIIYLHISFSLDADISAFDLNRLVSLMKGLPFVVTFATLTTLSILFLRKISLALLAGFTLLIFYKTFSLFLISYDKLLLIMNVVYLISAYNMILLMGEELKLAIYKPGFDENSIDVESYRRQSIKILLPEGEVEAHITNMDKHGLVVRLNEDMPLKGNIEFKTELNGREFHGSAVVAVKYKLGYGLRIKKRKKSPGLLIWEDFYNISYRRGFSN